MSEHLGYSMTGIVMGKVSDGDFETKMHGVEYSTTPREAITVKNMEDWDNRKKYETHNDALKGRYHFE